MLFRSVKTRRELINDLAKNPECIVIVDPYSFEFRDIDDLIETEMNFTESRWVLFSNEFDEHTVLKIGKVDDLSVIIKNNTCDEIRAAFKYIVARERFLCHHISNIIINQKHIEKNSMLTNTELDILRLIAAGKSGKEIADIRVSSIHTIISHKKNIFRKLKVNNVYEAVKTASRAGLIEQAEYYI